MIAGTCLGGLAWDATVARAEPARAGDDPAARRRQELDDLRRQDLASELGHLGVPLQWQEHALPQLLDWRDRIEGADALRAQHGIEVDWTVTTMAELNDMRLRAAKASELAGAFGIQVDWRRYTWAGLDALARSIARTRRARPTVEPDADGLVAPGSIRRARRLGATPRDPDAIIEPTFAFDTPLVWTRPFGRRVSHDPDAILVPRFMTVPSPPPAGDGLMNPWRR